MKKILSIVLTMTMLFSILCVFTYATEEDTPYSGGSGTEEDPFLISCDADLQELSNNIKTDSYLWSTEYHYKLTNDIVTSTTIGQLNSSLAQCVDCPLVWHEKHEDHIGYNSLVKRDENTNKLLSTYNIVEASWFREDTYGIYDTSPVYETGDKKYKNAYYQQLWEGGIADTMSYKGKFWSAAFTGSFDGNGHTITLKDNEYLFGFIESGAVIKNLTLKGENASLIYCLGQETIVTNFTLKSKNGWVSEYNYGTVKNCCIDIDDGGICKYNYGTIKDCNFSSNTGQIYFENRNKAYNSIVFIGTVSSIAVFQPFSVPSDQISYSHTSVSDIVDIGGQSDYGEYKYLYYYTTYPKNWVVLTETESNRYYNLNDCKAAGGDPSAYAGFDFENVWVMLNGMPYLRSACRLAAGDLDCNDKIGIVDSYMLKMLIAGAGETFEYRTVMASDINGDGSLNSADSLLLKRVVAGTESINEYRYKD